MKQAEGASDDRYQGDQNRVAVQAALYAALAYWLLMAGPIAFTIGVGLLYLPAIHWITGLMYVPVLGPMASATVYVPFAVAAAVGLALGRLGWEPARRILGWVAVLLLLTVGVAAQVALDVALSQTDPAQTWATFWVVLQGSTVSAGIALVVGILVRLIDVRRTRTLAP